jgi:hypothetical protein
LIRMQSSHPKKGWTIDQMYQFRAEPSPSQQGEKAMLEKKGIKRLTKSNSAKLVN